MISFPSEPTKNDTDVAVQMFETGGGVHVSNRVKIYHSELATVSAALTQDSNGSSLLETHLPCSHNDVLGNFAGRLSAIAKGIETPERRDATFKRIHPNDEPIRLRMCAVLGVVTQTLHLKAAACRWWVEKQSTPETSQYYRQHLTPQYHELIAKGREMKSYLWMTTGNNPLNLPLGDKFTELGNLFEHAAETADLLKAVFGDDALHDLSECAAYLAAEVQAALASAVATVHSAPDPTQKELFQCLLGMTRLWGAFIHRFMRMSDVPSAEDLEALPGRIRALGNTIQERRAGMSLERVAA